MKAILLFILGICAGIVGQYILEYALEGNHASQSWVDRHPLRGD